MTAKAILKRSMLPGVIGMLLAIVGLACEDGGGQRWLFLLGALGMTFTALVEGHQLFIGLQLIVLSGTVVAFLPMNELSRGIIPLVVSVPVLTILFRKGALANRNSCFGAVALAILGVGYALQQPLGFFVGGALISIFSAIELSRGFQPALIWLVLNLLFTGLAGWLSIFA